MYRDLRPILWGIFWAFLCWLALLIYATQGAERF
jgi:hypothetical protein